MCNIYIQLLFVKKADIDKTNTKTTKIKDERIRINNTISINYSLFNMAKEAVQVMQYAICPCHLLQPLSNVAGVTGYTLFYVVRQFIGVRPRQMLSLWYILQCGMITFEGFPLFRVRSFRQRPYLFSPSRIGSPCPLAVYSGIRKAFWQTACIAGGNYCN